MAAHNFKILRIVLVGDLWGLLQEIKHLTHIDQGLSDFAIDCAQKIQRHRYLNHVGIHQNEIAYSHRSRLHTHRGEHHDHNQTCGDQKRLAKVQERQRIRGLERCHLIQFHRAIVAPRFTCFGPEILHGFKVQQAINRLLICVRVLVIHLLAQLHAPLRDSECKPNIKSNRDEHGCEIPNIKQEK